MEGKTKETSGHSGSTKRATRPSAGLRAARSRGCSAVYLPSWGLKDLSLCSGIQTRVFRDSRGKAGLAVPPPHPERRIPCYWPGDKTPNPRRHSRGAPGAADTAGTWARPQRCAKHPLARPNLCSPASAPAGGERDPPPFHFAPVRGNLRSVTRILKRATCSAGRAALGGIGGLGRRGLGTPGSGGHAGVDAPRRPAAAAR